MTQHLPLPTGRIAVVSITRHGIALAGRVVAALPGARPALAGAAGADDRHVMVVR